MMTRDLKLSKIGDEHWLCMMVGVAWVLVCKLTPEQMKAYHEVATQYKVKP